LDGTNNTYAGASSCLTGGSGACNPTQMAQYDMQRWVVAMQALIPSNAFGATITCTTALFPVNCTVNIQWTENLIAAGSATGTQQTFAANAGLQIPTYTIYVQP
jgi:hypothetical protein